MDDGIGATLLEIRRSNLESLLEIIEEAEKHEISTATFWSIIEFTMYVGVTGSTLALCTNNSNAAISKWRSKKGAPFEKNRILAIQKIKELIQQMYTKL